MASNVFKAKDVNNRKDDEERAFSIYLRKHGTFSSFASFIVSYHDRKRHSTSSSFSLFIYPLFTWNRRVDCSDLHHQNRLSNNRMKLFSRIKTLHRWKNFQYVIQPRSIRRFFYQEKKPQTLFQTLSFIFMQRVDYWSLVYLDGIEASRNRWME